MSGIRDLVGFKYVVNINTNCSRPSYITFAFNFERTKQFTPALAIADPKKIRELQHLLVYFQGIWDLPGLRCIKARNLFCRNVEIEESFQGPSLRFTSETLNVAL